MNSATNNSLKRKLASSDSGETASDWETASRWSCTSFSGDSHSQGAQFLEESSTEQLIALLAQKILDDRRNSHQFAGTRPSDKQQDTLAAFEHRQRKGLETSLVLRHLEEVSGETDSQLQGAVFNILHACGMEASELQSSVVSIRRVGSQYLKKVATIGATGSSWLGCPRVVIVEFSSVDSKMAVKRAGWRLARTMYCKVSLDHAITLEQQHIRAAQWGQIQAAKAKGWRWCWSDVVPHKLLVFPRGAVSSLA